jgi:hypothetical protein
VYRELWTILASSLGVVTRNEEEFVTELRHLPDGWMAVGGLALLAALASAIVWMYRHEGRIGATVRVRTGLACVRCIVFLLLAIILLEPVRVRILRKWVDSYTILLVDRSSSMDLTDSYRDEATADRVKKLLNTEQLEPTRRTAVARTVLDREDRTFLRGLAANNRVKLYDYSHEPRLRGTIRAAREQGDSSDASSARTGADAYFGVDDAPIDGSATGSSTNMERAVYRSVEALGSAPIAGLVVISDGGFNQGAPAEDIARFALDHEIPIHVVGVGDPSSPLNARVTEILAPPNAFQKDPFAITAQLSAEGLEGRSLQVVLRERNTAGGSGRLVDTKAIHIGPGGSIEMITFERRQPTIGRFVYSVEVAPIEGETVTDDNSKQTTVNVIDARTRVLLIASQPSWEYRFVSRLLTRDDTFDLSCWLQSADFTAVRDGNTIIDHLPTLAEELFEYDVVILMDPETDAIDEQWCLLIDTLVTEYGGGVLLTAARTHTPTMMRDRTLKPLHDLLPVTLDPEADLVLNDIGHYQLSGSKLAIPETAYGHPIMALAEDPIATKLAWRGVGDVHWHYPVLREKPVATVLMQHSNPRMRNKHGQHVLAAVQFVGSGRSGFLAFDGTWRWRRQGTERFDRFWVQLIRYLAEGKLLGGSKRGMLLTEADQYSLGDSVAVTARLFDAQYKPLHRDQVTAQYVVDSDKSSFTLSARRDRPGWFEGQFVPDRTGNYRITLSMIQPGKGEPIEISREIRVARPNLEILRPQMDRSKLVALAQQSHGGRYYEVDEAGQLPDQIPDLHEEIPIRSRPRTLWDNAVVLTLLLSLLCLEWGVRKWNRLL